MILAAAIVVFVILAIPGALVVEQVCHASPRHFYERERAERAAQRR